MFGDPLSEVYDDPDHSVEERRFVIVATSNHHRLLVVVHTDCGERIRITSAREATPRERIAYEEGTEHSG